MKYVARDSDPVRDCLPTCCVDDLREGLDAFMFACHALARANGFWDEGLQEPLQKLFLIVTEITEAGEAIRAGTADDQCDKGIGLTQIEEEMADVAIRLFDFCQAFRIDLPLAIYMKHKYNLSRPFRHGKTC